MERLERIEFDDYARWYLDREVREKRRLPVPNLPLLRAWWMKLRHGGKMVPWFQTQAEWWICRISDRTELESLLFLPSPWTRAAGLVRPDEPRILANAARRAQEFYFRESAGDGAVAVLERNLDEPGPSNHGRLEVARLRAYYQRHQNGFQFDRLNCIVLRSLEDDERREMERWDRPETQYYLHDGSGRMLTYLTLLNAGRIEFRPVTAIVADRVG